MKKTQTIVFIILIFLPMFIYLNPFTWGNRKYPHYEPSRKTNNLIDELNRKYNLKMEVGDVIDTLWYFRDIKHNRISKLENFELIIEQDTLQNIDSERIKKYVKDFRLNFEHKNYFDSINIRVDFDSIVYKTKLK